MVSYNDLIDGVEVEVTDGMFRGQKGIVAYGAVNPNSNMPEVMVWLGEKNRESNQPIVHPFGYGVNKIQYLKVVGE